MDTARIDVGDLTFDAVVAGPDDGRLVLLLHGFPQSSHEWAGVVPALVEAGCRVVAPDQRGYSPGARPAAVEDYRMSALVGDVVGLLDALGAPQTDVVGHDWGAAVAWHLAIHHPSRVRTLAAVSVPHPLAFVEALTTDPEQRRMSQYMRDWKKVGVTEERLLADGLSSLFGGARIDFTPYSERMREPGELTAALNWYRAQSRADLDGVGPVTVPTLHVWSDGDAALGRTGAEATAKHVDAAYRFEVLPGISHWVPEEVPEELSRLLVEHLASHPVS